jgi:RNA polymerase sigma-70 factor (ECF subfamily)
MNQLETFNQYRSLLFAIAYRMLSSAMDAEDIVQETFLRWQQVNPMEIESPKAYLTTITTRLCLDQLRSARTQREVYVGPWLPEPLLAESAPDSAEIASLADSLSMAFLVLMESLSPVERAVYLLREVFDYDYPEIARIVSKSEIHCRQIVSRARQHLSSRRPRYEVLPGQQQRLSQQFAQACFSGDLPGLMTILAEDIVLHSDGGGKIKAAMRPIYGPDHVARFLLGILRKIPPGFTIHPAQINGQPGFITYIGNQPQIVLILDIMEERIGGIYVVVNPDKLRGLPDLDKAEPGVVRPKSLRKEVDGRQ